LADLGEEALSVGCLFGDGAFLVAVVADGGGGDKDLGGVGELGDGLGEEAGALGAGVEDGGLALLGPAAAADVLASEVEDGVDAFEVAGVEACAGGVPLELALLGGASDEGEDLVTAGGEEVGDGGPEEARGARDGDGEAGEVGVFLVEGEVAGEAGVSEGEAALEALLGVGVAE
jgi:hypothetical protein